MEEPTFYHTQHSCGHSVYWSVNPDRETLTRPCPWCRRERPASGFCFRELEDGAHLGLKSFKIQHMANGTCCRARPWRRWLRGLTLGQPIPNPHSEP